MYDLDELFKPSESLIVTCARLADEAHFGQVRKYTGDPYIVHPMRVAARVTMLKGAPDVVIGAAWCHDIEEDCQHMPALWWEGVPPQVRYLVDMLTNPSKKFPQLKRAERKQMDRNHYIDAPYWIKVVKLVDRIDNLKDIVGGIGVDDKFIEKYLEESRLLVDVLVKDPCGDHIHKLYSEYEKVRYNILERLGYGAGKPGSGEWP